MRILLVEDTDRHVKEAYEVLREFGVEVILATNLYEAQQQIECYPRIDGVISDIFIPYSGEPKYDANEPCGLGVAIFAKEKKYHAFFAQMNGTTDGESTGFAVQPDFSISRCLTPKILLLRLAKRTGVIPLSFLRKRLLKGNDSGSQT